ncbi:MAG: hypothetical protein JO148_07860 [Acidimicrobiia bacterium]|nr:hypothetical protein [Acidimicrobiia bacterium]
MATAGGLEVHTEMNHAPAPAEVVLNPAALDADLQFDEAPERGRALAEAALSAVVRSAPVRRTPHILRGYDPTLPLTAVLVLTMLVAGLGAVVHRSANSSHTAIASLASGSSATGGTTATTLAPASQPPATSAPLPAGSPAAIPPAGSQPPAAAQNSTELPCKQTIDSLSSRNSRRSFDIGGLIQAGTFPALPLPGFERPSVAALGHYGTAREYFDAAIDPNDPTSAQLQQLLVQNGFVSADLVQFENAGSTYGAIVLQFTAASGARTFNQQMLLDECGAGYLHYAQAIPRLTGGMDYQVESAGPPFRATFVAGDSVVRLNICECVQAPDDQALVGQWAQAVASAVGAG